MELKKFEQWQDMIARLYPEIRNKHEKNNVLSRTVTFQVTDACSLACTYCYQINKGTRRMRFETAKKLIDMLLAGDERLGDLRLFHRKGNRTLPSVGHDAYVFYLQQRRGLF